MNGYRLRKGKYVADFSESLTLILLFVFATLAGLVIRVTLSLAGQRWAATYSNTITYLLLPSVGLVIVLTISQSISLSLGMIGALSIVRFRHPVKSPLELVIYFLLLTVGVALSTRPYLALALVFVSSAIILGVSWYQRLGARRGQSTFPLAPDDGDRVFILEVVASSQIGLLETSPDLIFAHWDRETSVFTYKLAFAHRAPLDYCRAELEREKAVNQMSGSFE